MIVQVDWYRMSGKWYAGGEVNIGDARLWQDDHSYPGRTYNAVAVAIAAHQTIMRHSTYSSGEYLIVVRNVEGWDVQTEFCNHLFSGEDFPPVKEQRERH
jgi:hypothetical protein